MSSLPSTDWAGLPYQLLNLIVDKLEFSANYLNFGTVCTPWLSAVRDNQNRLRINFSNQAPLLLIRDENEHWCKAYDVTKDGFLELKLSLPYERRFCGSSEGWLVGVNRDSTVTLHKNGLIGVAEPISVNLPCLFPRVFEPGMENDPDFVDPADVSDYHVYKAVVRCESDRKTNPKELTVVVLFGEDSELAFIRPGTKDATWTIIDDQINGKRFCATDIFLYKDQFYVLCYCGGLICFDILKDQTITPLKLVASLASQLPVYDHIKYLVKSYEGELWLVKRHIDWLGLDQDQDPDQDPISRFTKGFEVFRFDFDRKSWNELRSLGDTALFLGDNSSASVMASSFPGCQPNCIYFTHDNDDVQGWQKTSISDLGVYNMESKIFKFYYSIDPNSLRKMSKRPPVWFAPRIII